jgi:hypothetical protein
LPNRSVVVRPEERPAAIGGWRDFVLRVEQRRGKCRGHKPETMRTDVMSAKRNQKGAGADNSVLARIPGTKVAKANDADDQPVDCQAAAPAQGAQHSAGA